jgi:hypothetical protein
MGTTGMGTTGYAEGQIVDERPVAVGVAEVNKALLLLRHLTAIC